MGDLAPALQGPRRPRQGSSPRPGPEVAPGDVRTPPDLGLCGVCGRPLTGRRPQRVCSPRCRIARWRQARAEATGRRRSPGSTPRTPPCASAWASSSGWSGRSRAASWRGRRPGDAAGQARRRLAAGRRGYATLGPERRMSVKHLRPPWRPGESGNPLGVNRGVFTLAAEIRRQTGQGQTLVEFYTAMFEGRPIPVPGGRAQRPTLEHRHMAAQWLADRGWGKAKEIIELTGDAPTTTPSNAWRSCAASPTTSARRCAACWRRRSRPPMRLGRRPRAPRADLAARRTGRRPRGRRACDARTPAQRRPRGRTRAGGRRGVHGSSGQRRSGRRVPCRSPRSPGQARARIARSDGRRDRYPPDPAGEGQCRPGAAPSTGQLRAAAEDRGTRRTSGRRNARMRARARPRARSPGLWDPPPPPPKIFAVGRSIFGAPTRTSWRGCCGQSPRSRRQGPQAGTPRVCHPVPMGPPAGWVKTPGWRVAVGA